MPETKKERKSAINDKYYKSHRAILIVKAVEKIPCVCGNSVCRSYMSRHRKTAKHLAWAASQPV